MAGAAEDCLLLTPSPQPAFFGVMRRIAQNWDAVLLDSTARHFGTGFWNEGNEGDTPREPLHPWP
jgi:hypothetical protein